MTGLDRVSLRGAAVSAAVIASLGLLAGPLGSRALAGPGPKSYEEAYKEFLELGEIRDWPAVPWRRAFIHKSRYYEVKTNTSTDVARYIGALMDAQAEALLRIFQFRMALGRVNIWATRTREDFIEVSARQLMVMVGPDTGAFWTRANGGTICLPYIKQGSLNPGNMMMHEATHQFLNAALGQGVPIWVSEGLAVLFQESRYNPLDGKLEVFIVPRAALVGLQADMRNDEHVRLSEVLTTPKEMFGAEHYASAWGLIYWIFRSAGNDMGETLRRQKAFNTYLADIKKNRKGHDRLFAYLGTSVQEAEKPWKEWVLALDPDDERGGTRVGGEPPYVPKKKTGGARQRELDERIAGNKRRLEELAAEINESNSQVALAGAELKASHDRLSALKEKAEAGQRADYEAYVQAMERHNAHVDRYNALLAQMRAKCAECEQLFKETNSLVDEHNRSVAE